MYRYLLSSFSIVAIASFLQAQEGTLTFKSGKTKSLAVEIKDETAAGIVVGKITLPADDILDVEYKVKPIAVQVNGYRPAITAEEAAIKALKDAKLTDAKRADLLGEAITKYAGAITALEGLTTELDRTYARFAKRHCVFKIAYLTAKRADYDNDSAAAAIAKLKEFKDAHPNSWQIGRALEMLARLQIQKEMFADAEKTFEAIAVSNVPETVRNEALLRMAEINIRTNKYPEALKRLDAIMEKTKDVKSPLAIRVRVMQAECLLADKGTSDKGRTVLRDLIKDSTDKGVKAQAYNALGISLFNAGALKDARWEFLWVDVVYNQDRNEHAKALYYLWRIFKDLNEGERAQECLETLMSDPFAGNEFQDRARRESKTS